MGRGDGSDASDGRTTERNDSIEPISESSCKGAGRQVRTECGVTGETCATYANMQIGSDSRGQHKANRANYWQ